jgi:hypothetical protein
MITNNEQLREFVAGYGGRAAWEAWQAALNTELDNAKAEVVRLRGALESISKNGCCDKCQEAKVVAEYALRGNQIVIQD